MVVPVELELEDDVVETEAGWAEEVTRVGRTDEVAGVLVVITVLGAVVPGTTGVAVAGHVR